MFKVYFEDLASESTEILVQNTDPQTASRDIDSVVWAWTWESVFCWSLTIPDLGLGWKRLRSLWLPP